MPPHVLSCGPGYWDSSWATLSADEQALKSVHDAFVHGPLSCSLSWGLLGRDLQRGGNYLTKQLQALTSPSCPRGPQRAHSPGRGGRVICWGHLQ